MRMPLRTAKCLVEPKMPGVPRILGPTMHKTQNGNGKIGVEAGMMDGMVPGGVETHGVVSLAIIIVDHRLPALRWIFFPTLSKGGSFYKMLG